jgi:hypothetical protein
MRQQVNAAFAVSRRTREIGVRVALGGSRPRILRAVFAQPLRQLGMGLLAGGVLIVILIRGDAIQEAVELGIVRGPGCWSAHC